MSTGRDHPSTSHVILLKTGRPGKAFSAARISHPEQPGGNVPMEKCLPLLS